MSPSSNHASEQLIEVQRVNGLKKEGSYIVRLKDGVDKAQHLRWLSTRLGAASTITHDYPAAFANAYAGTFDEAALDALRRSPDVARIAEDAIGELFVTTVQEDAPWGLHRISRRPKLPFKYTYDAAAMGKGVDIYIIDTGIDLTHEEFVGRVSWGWAAPGLPHLDDKGHGTQVAGVAAGTTYGVAKEANLIAVKSHDKEGNAEVSVIVAAIAWVWKTAEPAKRPAVVNMSFGVAADKDID